VRPPARCPAPQCRATAHRAAAGTATATAEALVAGRSDLGAALVASDAAAALLEALGARGEAERELGRFQRLMDAGLEAPARSGAGGGGGGTAGAGVVGGGGGSLRGAWGWRLDPDTEGRDADDPLAMGAARELRELAAAGALCEHSMRLLVLGRRVRLLLALGRAADAGRVALAALRSLERALAALSPLFAASVALSAAMPLASAISAAARRSGAAGGDREGGLYAAELLLHARRCVVHATGGLPEGGASGGDAGEGDAAGADAPLLWGEAADPAPAAAPRLLWGDAGEGGESGGESGEEGVAPGPGRPPAPVAPHERARGPCAAPGAPAGGADSGDASPVRARAPPYTSRGRASGAEQGAGGQAAAGRRENKDASLLPALRLAAGAESVARRVYRSAPDRALGPTAQPRLPRAGLRPGAGGA